MPVQLQTQFCRATVVFDATGYTTRIKGASDATVEVPVVEEQFKEMFGAREYWYLPEKEFSPTETPGAGDTFVTRLRERIESYELADTQLKINLFFYVRLEDTPEEKTKALQRFIGDVARGLLVPTLDFHAYIVADKYEQNSTAAMQNFMAMAGTFLETRDTNAPQLILLEARPLARIDGAVRATVRVANIMSRDGQLYKLLQQKAADHLLWNWTMSEFDQEALDAITEELESVRRRLDDNGGAFPRGELQNNLRLVQGREEQRNIGQCSLNAEYIPVPAGAVHRCFFGTKAADEAAAMLSDALRETYRANMKRKCFPKYTEAETFALCRQMTENIPLNHWESIEKELLDSIDDTGREFDPPHFGLHRAYSLTAMREQIGDAIQQMNKALKSYYLQYMARFIARQFNAYLGSSEAKENAKRLRDRASELEMKIKNNYGVSTGTEYLADIERIGRETAALYSLQYYEKNQFVLISDTVNRQWADTYDHCLPTSLKGDNDVYNYMYLQAFEFQTLTLLTFRTEELKASQYSMFRLKREDAE